MGLFNTSIEETSRFGDHGIKLEEVINANMPPHRTLVIVTDLTWLSNDEEDRLIRTAFDNRHPGIFPVESEYGDNFLANVDELFNQPGSDVTVFKRAERIDESPNGAQWEYLLTKMAEGAHFVNETEGRTFDYRQRGVLLLCSRVPEFVKRRPDLWPVIVEI